MLDCSVLTSRWSTGAFSKQHKLSLRAVSRVYGFTSALRRLCRATSILVSSSMLFCSCEASWIPYSSMAWKQITSDLNDHELNGRKRSNHKSPYLKTFDSVAAVMEHTSWCLSWWPSDLHRVASSRLPFTQWHSWDDLTISWFNISRLTSCKSIHTSSYRWERWGHSSGNMSQKNPFYKLNLITHTCSDSVGLTASRVHCE